VNGNTAFRVWLGFTVLITIVISIAWPLLGFVKNPVEEIVVLLGAAILGASLAIGLTGVTVLATSTFSAVAGVNEIHSRRVWLTVVRVLLAVIAVPIALLIYSWIGGWVASLPGNR
jgi:hypothetical protein